MDELQKGRCKGCDAPILWGVTAKNGKAVPLNDPSEPRFVMNGDGKMQVVKSYTSHYVTCPDAARFRAKAPAGVEG